MKKSHQTFRRNIHYLMISIMCLCVQIFLCSTSFATIPPTSLEDTCLLIAAENLDIGSFSGYLYLQFSDMNVTIRPGDVLSYDIFIARSSPEARGAIEIDFKDKPSLQHALNQDIKDQNGLNCHWTTRLTPAIGRWYNRSFSLNGMEGWQSTGWSVVFSGDSGGWYVRFLDNIQIKHADGTQTVIYNNGPAACSRLLHKRAFSRFPVMQPIPRVNVSDSMDIIALVYSLRDIQRVRYDLIDLEDNLEFGRTFSAERAKDNKSISEIIDTKITAIDELLKQESISSVEAELLSENISSFLESIMIPEIREYTGHLVSHAHIDSQWLWKWPETLDEFKKTFSQAIEFMDEFPGFTFTQSSSTFYQATEERWPELFKRIKEKVKKGQWEIVGGRITEADNNLISPEAHVREFLYGQRYLRERFDGKQAVVEWEPDTFGHNAQMPQIVKLSGCDYYYFCRAGKDEPLFWWEGLDGTRILAFQEVKSWYNSDLTTDQFHEALQFNKQTGCKEMLWVYGVGNHGGGASREEIQVAKSWMEKPYLPRVKFSTATEFFRTIEKKYDLSSLPVIHGELNSVFEGCYTTHGDIKHLNNTAQALVESAEAVAAIAAQYGFPYPRNDIRLIWEDICWNHHHDTIDGSSVHEPYARSKEVYARAIANSRLIQSDALSFLATKVEGPEGAIMVFNPAGCVRDSIVEFTIPPNMNTNELIAVSNTETVGVQVIDEATRAGMFSAHDLPSYGYRVYEIKKGESPTNSGVVVSADGTMLENSVLRIMLDSISGEIKSIYHKQLKREFIAEGGSANRLEIYWEKPHGMSAWIVGTIDHIEIPDSPVSLRIVEKGTERAVVECSRTYRENIITQRLSLTADSDYCDCEIRVDWKETGCNSPETIPFLKLAFDLNIVKPECRYDIPFGNVVRPIENKEAVALKWIDLSNDEIGFSLINDSKHGCSVTTGTLKLSLIRTPLWPDPTSDNYPQTIRYALFPHRGKPSDAGTVGRSFAWVHPVITTVITGKGTPSLPSEMSMLSIEEPAVMLTAVKRAEDDDDLIVRYYESSGQPANSNLTIGWPVKTTQRINFLEDPLESRDDHDSNQIPIVLSPYEIQTLKINLVR